MIAVTPEEIHGYRYCQGAPSDSMMYHMANSLRAMTAKAMRLEFEAEHVEHERQYYCVKCLEDGEGDEDDPRHNYTDADWDRAAEKLLRGETRKEKAC